MTCATSDIGNLIIIAAIVLYIGNEEKEDIDVALGSESPSTRLTSLAQPYG